MQADLDLSPEEYVHFNFLRKAETRMPKVSVLMPVFNGKDFIDDAIKSILDQTYSDLEFLIIDDGSIDDTLMDLTRFIGKM